MSFGIDADRIVATLWDTLRPGASLEAGEGWGDSIRERSSRTGFGIKEPGLVVTLDLRLSHYALSCDEYHRSVMAHVILCGNTSVFAAATSDHRRWWELEHSQWDNTSNHDSCWRTDGFRFLNTLFSNMTEQMGKEMQAHGHNPIAPKDYSQFCALGTIAGPPFERVLVDHQRVPGENYRRRLVAVTRPGKPDYVPEIAGD